MRAVQDPTTQAEQDAEMRLHLIALELVSHGKCQSWGGATGRGGGSEAVGPPGESNPPHLRLAASYRTARNWTERQDVIDQARVEVLALRRVAPIPIDTETRAQLAERMLIEAVDLTPQQVTTTKQFGLFSARQVVALRMAAELDPETGRPREDKRPDWQIQASRMIKEGYSLNAIRFKLRVRKDDLLEWARDQNAA